MFKFEKHIEIKKAHEHYKKLNDKSYSLEVRAEKKGDKKLYDECSKLREEVRGFVENSYSKIIFDAFIGEKPTIHNSAPKNYVLNKLTMEYELISTSNEFDSWENIFGQDFNKLSSTMRSLLVGAVEEDGKYRLPPEYYKK